MSHGGARKGAGRPKGSANKANKLAIEKAREGGELPHEFLLRIARGESIDGEAPSLTMRVDAAKAAAPYFAPKLAQVTQEIETKITGVVSAEPMTEEEWVAAYGISRN